MNECVMFNTSWCSESEVEETEINEVHHFVLRWINGTGERLKFLAILFSGKFILCYLLISYVSSCVLQHLNQYISHNRCLRSV